MTEHPVGKCALDVSSLCLQYIVAHYSAVCLYSTDTWNPPVLLMHRRPNTHSQISKVIHPWQEEPFAFHGFRDPRLREPSNGLDRDGERTEMQEMREKCWRGEREGEKSKWGSGDTGNGEMGGGG